jgi:hypothetical protein
MDLSSAWAEVRRQGFGEVLARGRWLRCRNLVNGQSDLEFQSRLRDFKGLCLGQLSSERKATTDVSICFVDDSRDGRTAFQLRSY